MPYSFQPGFLLTKGMEEDHLATRKTDVNDTPAETLATPWTMIAERTFKASDIRGPRSGIWQVDPVQQERVHA